MQPDHAVPTERHGLRSTAGLGTAGESVMRGQWVERLRRFLFEHPLVKALLLGLFGLVGNVLAG